MAMFIRNIPGSRVDGPMKMMILGGGTMRMKRIMIVNHCKVFTCSN
jgi:hypothetical protein